MKSNFARYALVALLALELSAPRPVAASVMTTSSKDEYVQDATARTVFPFTFTTSATDKTWVQVLVDGLLQTSGFTVKLNANQSTSPGGSVTFTAAPKQNAVVRVQRSVPETQPTNFRLTGTFSPAAHEAAFDRLTLEVQDVAASAGGWKPSIDYETSMRTAGDAGLTAQVLAEQQARQVADATVAAQVTALSATMQSWVTSEANSRQAQDAYLQQLITALQAQVTALQPGVGVTPTTTTVTSSNLAATQGTTVNFTVSVSPSVTGSVTLFDGTTPLITTTLTASSVVIPLQLALGTHTIKATYNGSATYATSTSSTLTQAIVGSLVATTTTIASGTNPSFLGQSVTFTATVRQAGSQALLAPGTTTVSFFVDGVSVGSGALSNVTGTATWSTSALTVGSHTVVASFSGDATYASSVTAVGVTQSVTVLNTASTTAVASSINPVLLNTGVTFTATVTGAGAVPTGTVSFNMNGSVVGPVTLSGSGTASITIGGTSTPGTLPVFAVYSGDAYYSGSTSSTIQQVFQATVPGGTRLGTNLNWANYWDPEKLMSDLILQAQPFSAAGQSTDVVANWVTLDAAGWPTTASAFHTIVDMNVYPGIYRLTFTNKSGAASDAVTASGITGVTVTKPSNGTAGCDYDSPTKVSTCNVTVPAFSTSALDLAWGGTTGGITNAHLMRPLKTGSGFHTAGTVLSDFIVDRLAWFKAVRTMQTQGGSNKVVGYDRTWANRTAPVGPQLRSRGASPHEGGVAIELLAAMANQAGKDLWINIPLLADDDYIIRMAQTLKCGSDGTQPYAVTPGTAASACTAGTPAFAPLSVDLNLYVEAGNENWNGNAAYWELENEGLAVMPWSSGRTWQIPMYAGNPVDIVPPYIRVGTATSSPVYKLTSENGVALSSLTSAQIGVYPPLSCTTGSTAPSGTGTFSDGTCTWTYVGTMSSLPTWIGDLSLDYDGTGASNVGYMGWRRTAYLGARASILFRQVFGATAMMTRVRPILAGQRAVQETLSQGLNYVSSTWTNATANRPGNNAYAGYYGLPVSAYFYGVATDSYSPAGSTSWNSTSASTIIQASLTAMSTGLLSTLAADASIATTWGLKYLVYEGGESLFPSSLTGGTASNLTKVMDASYGGPTWSGYGFGANITNNLPAADQSAYIYGTMLKQWQSLGGDLFMHFTMGESASGGSMFGLCPPVRLMDGTLAPYATDLGTVNTSGAGTASDCRSEAGPKWDAIKAYSRYWNGALPTAAAPTFSPAAGTYSSTQTVTLATTSGGASIRYTTDGSDPSPSVGLTYSAPFSVAATTTVKAIAFGATYTPSAISSATYTISAGVALTTTLLANVSQTNTGTQWTTQAATVSFPNAGMLVALVSSIDVSNSNAVATVAGAGLTWTKAAEYDLGGNGGASIWTARATGAGSGTVTATWALGQYRTSMVVVEVNSATRVGAAVNPAPAGTTASVAITPTTSGSVLLSVIVLRSAVTSGLAVATDTILGTDGDGALARQRVALRRTNTVTSGEVGTSLTTGLGSPAATAYDWAGAAVEIVP